MTRASDDARAYGTGGGGAARALLAGMGHCALGSLAAGGAASVILGALVLLLGG